MWTIREKISNVFLLTCLVITLVVLVSGRSSNRVDEILLHITKACEVSWPAVDTTSGIINSCVARGMAAMDAANHLRDSELKRLLMSSEKDLRKCQEELANGKKK